MSKMKDKAIDRANAARQEPTYNEILAQRDRFAATVEMIEAANKDICQERDAALARGDAAERKRDELQRVVGQQQQLLQAFSAQAEKANDTAHNTSVVLERLTATLKGLAATDRTP